MIPIQNIYYMLSYAFKVLNEEGYKDIATEQFHNVGELCAAILSKGVSSQLKRGLDQEYIPQTDTLSTIRGKIDITESLKKGTMYKRQIVCNYDEFSVDIYKNRILKSTMLFLIQSDISKARKKELRKLLVFFSDVQLLNIYTIDWKLSYHRNNQTYKMLISICYLVVKGLLQTNSDGTIQLMDFIDEQRMSRLYEKFILEYYRKEFPEITTQASQIPWQLDDEMSMMLPVMQTDIMLSKDEKVLIIDAKYYSRTTQVRFDVHTLHSANLYQIFTYVKNKELEFKNKPHEVSGMILYARTAENTLPDNTYRMSGNKISVRTLDLNCDFVDIAKQLDGIIEDYFGILSK